ncbi:MAG: ABC transporter permease [Candidatus Bipolaricaulia bacterium]
MRRRIVLILLLGTFIGLTIWIPTIGKVGIYNVFTYEQILHQSWDHFKMVAIAALIAIAIGVPLGILVTRPGFTGLSLPVIGGAGVGQSIPSMAVIAIMAPLLGFGFRSAVVALIIYGLLPILRNSYAAIRNIDPAMIEAARGMGMSKGQIAWRIELPLARPVIMAGIRTSTVINVGTAALAVLVGGKGLGTSILTGVFSRQPLITLEGAAPLAAMAITLDYILEAIENWMTPRGLKVMAERGEV